jgi:hypothetical protein
MIARMLQGWNMAFKDGKDPKLTPQELDKRIADRKLGLTFLDGTTWNRVTSLSIPVRKAMAAEQHVLTKDSPRYIYGQGLQS